MNYNVMAFIEPGNASIFIGLFCPAIDQHSLHFRHSPRDTSYWSAFTTWWDLWFVRWKIWHFGTSHFSKPRFLGCCMDCLLCHDPSYFSDVTSLLICLTGYCCWFVMLLTPSPGGLRRRKYYNIGSANFGSYKFLTFYSESMFMISVCFVL